MNGGEITAIQQMDRQKNGQKVLALLTPHASPAATGIVLGGGDLGPYSSAGGKSDGMERVIWQGREAAVPAMAVVREERRKKKKERKRKRKRKRRSV